MVAKCWNLSPTDVREIPISWSYIHLPDTSPSGDCWIKITELVHRPQICGPKHDPLVGNTSADISPPLHDPVARLCLRLTTSSRITSSTWDLRPGQCCTNISNCFHRSQRSYSNREVASRNLWEPSIMPFRCVRSFIKFLARLNCTPQLLGICMTATLVYWTWTGRNNWRPLLSNGFWTTIKGTAI